MNYFEFYDLPVSFHPDQNQVKQHFYALSKKYHPDFYINESAEKQEEVLELSTLNNKAFQMLKDFQKRLQYVLELKGVVNDGENYVLPQHFLMEMMDVNEALMELEFDRDETKLTQIKQETSQIESDLDSQLDKLTIEFDQRSSAGNSSDDLLASIKDIYFRKKYLWRIQESLSKFN